MKKNRVVPRPGRKSTLASDRPSSSAFARSSPATEEIAATHRMALELAEDPAKRAALMSEALGAATGVGPNKPVAERLLAQFNSILPDKTDIAVALFMLAELRPANMLEAMLVTQMVGVHEAALTCLRMSASAGLSDELRDQLASRGTRWMRLFSEQLEQLQRLKGTTRQQRVTVEHVHVNAGGQAIVGVVGDNPHPKSISAPDLHVSDGAAAVGGQHPTVGRFPTQAYGNPGSKENERKKDPA